MDAETNQRICFLNLSSDEIIRSLYYNKSNDSVMTVSVLGSDYFSSLKCRTTRIECVDYLYCYTSFHNVYPVLFHFFTHAIPLCGVRYIQRGQPDAGFLLFGSESPKQPGFVEFDDLNDKLLTFSAQDR